MERNFNDAQVKAINHLEGACCVIASAGSGKSTILVERVETLVKQGVQQHDILTISFTRNTVEDLKVKLQAKGLGEVAVGTFHSISAKILFENGKNVANQPLEWQVANLFNPKSYSEKKPNMNDIMGFIGYQKSYMRGYNDEFVEKDSEYQEEELREYFKKYEEWKAQNRLYDFDDWLIECHNLLDGKNHSHHWKYILVDENQDSNMIQNLLIEDWCKTGNVFVVGDYRQCLYGFRGSEPETFMDFHKRWENTNVINMDINYRSRKEIVTNSNNFIKKYYGDYQYYSDSVPFNQEKAEINVEISMSKETEATRVVNRIARMLADKVDPEEIAVLYRNNAHSEYIECELKKRGIEYYISNDSSFFKRKEIDGVINYLRLLENPHDNVAFENIIKFRNYPINFFSNQVFDEIKAFSGRNNLSLYEGFTMFKFEKVWQTKNAKIFESNIERLRLQKDKKLPLSQIIDNIKMAFNMEEYIVDKYQDKEEREERLGSLETLKIFAKGYDVQNFINYAYISATTKKKDTKKKCIRLMTIHGSKGLEFDNVIVVGVQDTKFPSTRAISLIEEARIFYVGITRARHNLCISQVGEYSQFVDEYLH